MCTLACPGICLKVRTICVGLHLNVCVCHAVIWVFNCLVVCALLWGFVDAWQHMLLLWVCVLCFYSCECLCFYQSLCVCVCVLCNLHLGTGKWADVFIPELCMCVCRSLFVYVYFCVCLNEWALSGAAPCCASCIWSHLFWSSVGGTRMTLMYLNPRQTFLRQSSVWNQDNWAQSSWTSWSGGEQETDALVTQ